MKTQVLIIEDDQPIREGICDALEGAGFGTVGAESGETGLEQFRNGAFDLLLLDIVLPGRDGLSILKDIRSQRPGFPVILLTAKGDVRDRVDGLHLGADDYVVKPFNVQELLARIDAVMRRSPQRSKLADTVDLGGGTEADFQRRTLVSPSGRIALSERESDLLRYFVTHAERMISRDELIEQVWGLDPRGLLTRTVDVHVSRIREKLDTVHSTCQVRTLRGQGYVFEREPS